MKPFFAILSSSLLLCSCRRWGQSPSREVWHHPRVRLGKATPFDLVNAAERIHLAFEPNVHRYGTRSSVTLR